MAPKTHPALVLVGARKPYEIHQYPTVAPEGDEILLKVKYTASTPLDLHRADGGLLIKPPQIMGAAMTGVVEEAGPDVRRLKVGDKVVGWAFEEVKEKAHQEYVTASEWKFGKIPDGISMQQAVTVPENFITVFNTMATDLGLPTPWPKPDNYVPPRTDEPILIWGAASSVGQFALQILKWYGYRHLLATASPKHHDLLKQLGATQCFDYRNPGATDAVLNAATQMRGALPAVPMVIDCIGSLEGTLKPIREIVQSGSTVAIMLPVILRHAADDVVPEYSMDAAASLDWPEGVNVRGVRTHFVYRNEFFREKLPSEILPAMLSRGLVRVQRFRVIEGETLLERATNALNCLRAGISGEKLVWRVSDS